jgi:hypothetical protein
MQRVRDGYTFLLGVLETLPNGRYKSLAITELESSAMWAKELE